MVSDSEHGEVRRVRTVTWQDPRIASEMARGMSGLEYLEAIRDGVAPPPPFLVLVGAQLVSFDRGRATFAIQPSEFHYNAIGSVHGGLACTLLDSAMGCAVHSMLETGVGYTTLELKVNLVRAVTARTGRLLCESTTLHVGGRIATAEGRVVDEEGRLYAHGTTTCMLFRG